MDPVSARDVLGTVRHFWHLCDFSCVNHLFCAYLAHKVEEKKLIWESKIKKILLIIVTIIVVSIFMVSLVIVMSGNPEMRLPVIIFVSMVFGVAGGTVIFMIWT